MKKIFLLLFVICGLSVSAQNFTSVFGKQDFKDSLRFSKYPDASGDKYIGTQSDGTVIMRTLPSGTGQNIGNTNLTLSADRKLFGAGHNLTIKGQSNFYIENLPVGASTDSVLTVNPTTGLFGYKQFPTGGSGSIQSVTGDDIDNTDPLNPVSKGIPQSGTTTGNEVSGNVAFNDLTGIIGTNGRSIVFTDENNLLISDDDGANTRGAIYIGQGTVQITSTQSAMPSPLQSGLSINPNEVLVTANNSASLGLEGDIDFSANYDANSYVQKGYVDGLVTQPINQIFFGTGGGVTSSENMSFGGTNLSLTSHDGATSYFVSKNSDGSDSTSYGQGYIFSADNDLVIGIGGGHTFASQADYSAYFTDLSYSTVGWVNNQIAAAVSFADGVGTTVSGNSINLGGDASGGFNIAMGGGNMDIAGNNYGIHGENAITDLGDYQGNLNGNHLKIDDNANFVLFDNTAHDILIDVNGACQVTGTLKTGGYTVATLPAGVIGMTAYVTDALTPVYLGTLTGGGTTVTPVFYNGSTWVAH